MFIKLSSALATLIMMSQLITTTVCCDGRLLDSEADIYASKVWSNIPISNDQIKESLEFLLDPQAVNKKFREQESFSNFYSETLKNITDIRFHQFAQNCKKIYEESDFNTQVGVYMFLEKIAEKFKRDLQRADILKPTQQIKQKPTESIINAFFNADKNISVH